MSSQISFCSFKNNVTEEHFVNKWLNRISRTHSQPHIYSHKLSQNISMTLHFRENGRKILKKDNNGIYTEYLLKLSYTNLTQKKKKKEKRQKR